MMDSAVILQRTYALVRHMSEVNQNASVLCPFSLIDRTLYGNLQVLGTVAAGKRKMFSVLMHHILFRQPVRKHTFKNVISFPVCKSGHSLPYVSVKNIFFRPGESHPDLHKFHVD